MCINNPNEGKGFDISLVPNKHFIDKTQPGGQSVVDPNLIISI